MIITDAVPFQGLDGDLGFVHPRVRGQEVLCHQDGELLRGPDPVLLGQQVDRVLLTVGCDDVGVVSLCK